MKHEGENPNPNMTEEQLDERRKAQQQEQEKAVNAQQSPGEAHRGGPLPNMKR